MPPTPDSDTISSALSRSCSAGCRQVPGLARRLGSRAFVLCGSRTLTVSGLLKEIAELLSLGGVESVCMGTLSREPEVDDVDRISAELRRLSAGRGDFLLAAGGGSAIDLAKAAAAMAVNTESPTVKDYLEGVGQGLKIIEEPLPVLAMPTTAGTGCEATKNAVISSYRPAFKRVCATSGSCRGSPWSIPN